MILDVKGGGETAGDVHKGALPALGTGLVLRDLSRLLLTCMIEHLVSMCWRTVGPLSAKGVAGAGRDSLLLPVKAQ